MHPPPAWEALLVFAAILLVDNALHAAPVLDDREPRGPAFQLARFATLFLVSILLFSAIGSIAP